MLKICTWKFFHTRKSMVVSKFEFGNVLALFWGPWGQNGGQIEVKLQISHLIWSLGAKNLHWEVFSHEKVGGGIQIWIPKRFHPFLGHWGSKQGSKGSKRGQTRVKMPISLLIWSLGAKNLQWEVFSREKVNGGIQIWYPKRFDPYLGPWGSFWWPIWPKISFFGHFV